MTGNDAEFVHMFGAAGPLLAEVPKTPTKTYAPMGHSSLREANDLDDSHYDLPMRFNHSHTFMTAGAILIVLSAFGVGFALGLLHATQ